MFRPTSFVTHIKDLFYSGRDIPAYRDDTHSGFVIRRVNDDPQAPNEKVTFNAVASGAFVNAFRAICDGNSGFLILNNPSYFPYSESYMRELMWRCHLFRDELAFFLLETNAKKFYPN